MIAQLILAGVILAALGGAFLSWRADLKAEGKREAIQAFKDQQLDAEVKAKWAAQKAERDAKELLSKATRRNRELDEKLAQRNADRRAESDARAREDQSYALWRETHLPDFVAQRLRRDAELTPDESRAADLSGRTSVQPPPILSPDPAGAVDESVFRRLRELVDRTTQAGMEAVRPSAK